MENVIKILKKAYEAVSAEQENAKREARGYIEAAAIAEKMSESASVAHLSRLFSNARSYGKQQAKEKIMEVDNIGAVLVVLGELVDKFGDKKGGVR